MRIAVILSGSIRFHHKSIETIAALRSSGHDVDVYIHCWKDIKDFSADSWSSHYTPTEPTDEILADYSPVSVHVESWREVRKEIKIQVHGWLDDGLIDGFTNFGMVGMWRSLESAYKLVKHVENYDMLLRLRFDCRITGDIFHDLKIGWSIPEAVDFSGICDQVAWYFDSRDKSYLSSYFMIYSRLEELFDDGCPFAPEIVLDRSLKMFGVVPHRPKVQFSIHGD